MRTGLTLAALLLLAAPSPGQYREYALPDGSRVGVYALGPPGDGVYAWYRRFPDGRGYGRASSVSPFSAPLVVEKRGGRPARPVDTFPALTPQPVWGGALYGTPLYAPPYYPPTGPVLLPAPGYTYP